MHYATAPLCASHRLFSWNAPPLFGANVRDPTTPNVLTRNVRGLPLSSWRAGRVIPPSLARLFLGGGDAITPGLPRAPHGLSTPIWRRGKSMANHPFEKFAHGSISRF